MTDSASTSTGGEIVEADLEQTRLKGLMARSAKKAYVLVHASKLGKRAYKYSARLDVADWAVVTDWTVDEEVLAEFRGGGIEVIVVPPTTLGRPRAAEQAEAAGTHQR
ncbi:hypothetical protein [Leifsonia xyli]|uniref:hypothetical protein n=1 Tax=Leifsonia xyli TaxID=1575 RepID=UPI003D667A11